jgi:RloB-like protein
VREDHPKRRQLRREGRRLQRKKASREGLPAILIVCEGRETEPNYLHGLCDARGINRANTTIVAGDGETDALGLVRKAQRRFAVDRDFDAVFVVCDCVGEDLATAVAAAATPIKNAAGKSITVNLIVSRPCFEFWLLLHFEYISRPFASAQEVIDLLRAHITDYDKADRQIYAKVGIGLDHATGHSQQLKAELAAIGADSPDTDMPALIMVLNSLRRRGL